MKAITLILITVSFFACKKQIFVEYGEGLDDWTTATHTNEVSPNYNVVFDQSKVHRLDFVFTSDNWDDMQDDLTDIVGSTGGGPGGGGPGGMTFSDETPQYFECELFYNGLEWYHVGVRYKGNSSLTASSGKLPFRIKFDKFEDTYIEITNQRFYGFKELSLGSNYNDVSVMRDKTASDLFRGFGVPAVRTVFYEIWIDKGTGTAEYFGVYTVNEIIPDSFLTNYFGSETGNCYKPDGDGAAFSTTGFTLDDFELKTNETSSKSDIQAMYNALHSSTRTTNPTQWKAGLEAVFDVDGFLKYLAVNNTIQNWDTYGNMTHNYYLYHDPSDDLIKWIVWDNNEAFGDGNGNRQALSFGMSEVGTDWPLINYIINNSDYQVAYEAYIDDFITSSFTYNVMDGIYSDQQNLLYTSVSNEVTGYSYINGAGNFVSAVSTLKSHCSTRISAANSY
jgi:spore coat protein CotH